MNYLQLCQRFVEDTGIEGQGPTTVTGQTGIYGKVVRWVRDADRAIQNKHQDWDFLWAEYSFETIAGVTQYVAPSTIGTWGEFWIEIDGEYRQLDIIGFDEWKRLDRATDEQDAPHCLAIDPQRNLRLYPAPDDEYTISTEYWRSPKVLATNTDTSLIPTRFERIILCRAKMYFAEHDEAPVLIQTAPQEYMEILREMEAVYLHGRSPSTKQTHFNVVPE